MKSRSIIAVLFLLVTGMQTTWAQGFRVYKSDGTVAQFSMRADSIVFYDGIGSDEDFGPFTPVNQCIVGTWYLTNNTSITFNEDGTTDFIAGATYKFLPYQGTVIFYDTSGKPMSIIKVYDLTSDQMVMSVNGSDVFRVLTKTQPALPVSISCAEAVELTKALPEGATSEETYIVTGYITEVVGNVSKNQQTFWMADTKDGGPVFEAYWANLPEGVTEFKAGMKVAITGHLMKFVNTAGDEFYEMKNADVVILEDGDGGQGGDQPGPGGDVLADLVNGGFESWIGDSIPTGWKSASTASNASLAKSYEARSGNFSCLVAKGNTVNRRLATQEITLEAGSYTFSFYAKSTTADVCQTRGGLVPVNADGSVRSYKYGDFVNINNSDWTLVTYDFVLTEKTTLCLIVMNPKNSTYSVSQDILVDDAALVK